MTELVRLWCPCSAKIGSVRRLDEPHQGRTLYLTLASRSLLDIDDDVRFTSMGAGCFIVTKPNGELVIEDPLPEYTCGKCKSVCSLGSRTPELLRLVGTSIAASKRRKFKRAKFTMTATVPADSSDER